MHKQQEVLSIHTSRKERGCEPYVPMGRELPTSTVNVLGLSTRKIMCTYKPQNKISSHKIHNLTHGILYIGDRHNYDVETSKAFIMSNITKTLPENCVIFCVKLNVTTNLNKPQTYLLLKFTTLTY